jgi:hypothetical protein
MSTMRWSWLIPALVAASAASALSLPALAETRAHDHNAAALHEATLDQGRKWATDAPLRDGMDRIRARVEPQLAAAHAGHFDHPRFKPIRNIE